MNFEWMSMTWEQFYKNYKPECLTILYWDIKSVYQSLTHDDPIPLVAINKHFVSVKHKKYGECLPGILYMFEWLTYLNDFSNINKPLPLKNLEWLSKHLYTTYFYLYLSDLKLIFEWILEGKYGKFYGSVDAQLIMSAFKAYSDEIIQVKYKLKSNKN